MGRHDVERLKADASGNTGLSEVLAREVDGFSSTEDAVRFLATRGFEVTPADLAEAAAAPDEGAAAPETSEDGYGALMRFIRKS